MSPIPQSRQSMPKVRSGCITCKIRHVKCDEQRPACLRCIRAKRSCQGYLHPAPVSHSQGTIQRYSIPFKVPGSQADRRLLHFYCTEIADKLADSSDATLWARLILQQCHRQSVIRRTVIALSALYQESKSGDQPSQGSHSRNAISKCHRQLCVALSSSTASVDDALVCSLLFYTFECLAGDPKAAIWHLDQGLTLLQRTLLNRQASFTSLADDELRMNLIIIFARLDVQATIFNPLREPILNRSPSPAPITIPHPLTSASHADQVLTALQNRTMHHLFTYLPDKSLAWAPGASIERHALLAQLATFTSATEELAAHLVDPQSNKPRQHVLRLLIQADMFRAILLEDPSRRLAHDVDLCLRAALNRLCALFPGGLPQGTPFALSAQMIPTLYYICMKTTSDDLRGRALALLRGSYVPVRDGLWDAKSTAAVVGAMGGDDHCGWETRLEDGGAGIVDVGGLDDVVRALRIS